jgi:hypothetical protein
MEEKKKNIFIKLVEKKIESYLEKFLDQTIKY